MEDNLLKSGQEVTEHAKTARNDKIYIIQAHDEVNRQMYHNSNHPNMSAELLYMEMYGN